MDQFEESQRRPGSRAAATKSQAGAHAAILDAARAVFLRDGLNARVESVLQAAGVVRSTFYRYFANLDAVIIELLVEDANHITRNAIASADLGTDDLKDRLVDIAARIIVSPGHQPIVDLVYAEGRALEFSNAMIAMPEIMEALREPFREILEMGRQRWVFRTDRGIEDLAAWIHRNIFALGMIPPIGGADIDTTRDFVKAFVLPGILEPVYATAPCSADRRLAAIDERLARIEKTLARG